jgi:hypothetical protein
MLPHVAGQSAALSLGANHRPHVITVIVIAPAGGETGGARRHHDMLPWVDRRRSVEHF